MPLTGLLEAVDNVNTYSNVICWYASSSHGVTCILMRQEGEPMKTTTQ